VSRCPGCGEETLFPHPKFPSWDEGCYEKSSDNLRRKLDEAVETINAMQDLIRPFTRGIAWERILKAYNVGAVFLGKNPDEFDRYLKKVGKL